MKTIENQMKNVENLWKTMKTIDKHKENNWKNNEKQKNIQKHWRAPQFLKKTTKTLEG